MAEKRNRPKKNQLEESNLDLQSSNVEDLSDDVSDIYDESNSTDLNDNNDDLGEGLDITTDVDPESYRYNPEDEGSFDNQMLTNFELLRNTKYLTHLTDLINSATISASGKRGLKTFLNNAFSEHTMLANYQSEVMPKLNLQIDMLILMSALKPWDLKNKLVITILNNIRSHTEKLITKSIGKHNERARQDVTDTSVTSKTEAYQRMERDMKEKKKKKEIWGF